MNRRGGLAFADHEEDAWTPDDEAGLQGMVLAEGEALPVAMSGKIIRLAAAAMVRRPVKMPVWGLATSDGRLALKDALILHVDDDSDGVLIGSPELRMWGSGDNAFEALSDFSQTFHDVLRSYETTPAEQLSPDAEEYLRLLQSLVAREAI